MGGRQTGAGTPSTEVRAKGRAGLSIIKQQSEMMKNCSRLDLNVD